MLGKCKISDTDAAISDFAALSNALGKQDVATVLQVLWPLTRMRMHYADLSLRMNDVKANPRASCEQGSRVLLALVADVRQLETALKA